MKICFFSPYFPNHFGGGEKHLLDVALEAAQVHQVCIAIPAENISKGYGTADLKNVVAEYEKFYGASLEKISFIYTPLGTSVNFFTKLLWTNRFDALYYVTDGSLFFSLAKYNYLHIQIPFTASLSFASRSKLNCWHSINTNSAFTKRIIEKNWQVTVGTVLHPMVDIDQFKEQEKEKIILHVGRFFRQLHSKRQDVLVAVFKKLFDRNSKQVQNWKLYLVGNIEDQNYFDEVKQAAQGYPIEFITTATRAELLQLYERATLYWHATGFEVAEELNPECVEHFGITTIEAMAAGVVPLVVGKGGQREVLGELYGDLNWATVDECIQKTMQYIVDTEKLEKMKVKTIRQAQKFSKSEFGKKVLKLFSV